MGWVKFDTRLPRHRAIRVLSPDQIWQLIEDACAYARGEALFGPALLEEHGLVRYGFGNKTRQRWNRLLLWEKFDGHCYLCGEAVTLSEFHVEHVVPLSRGGEDRW